MSSQSTKTESRNWNSESSQDVFCSAPSSTSEKWPKPAELYLEAGLVLAVTLGAVTAIQVILFAFHLAGA
jgi:hypothetical protein